MSDLLSTIVRSFQDIVVEGFLAGLYTAAFVVTIFGLYKRRSEGSTLFMLLITALMYLMSMIHFADHWYFARLAYVFHNTGPEGILNSLESETFAGEMTGSVAFATNTLLADCLFIWRCWIIWDRNWKVVLLPVLTTLVGTRLNLANEGALLSQNFIDTGTPYLGLSLATTLLVTIFIMFRIYQVSSELQKQSGGRFSLYTSATEIIVESALLYSVSLLVLMVLIVRMNSNYIYVQNIVAQTTGLAPTLILARISLGLARSSDTWQSSRRRGTGANTDLVFTSAAGNTSNTLNISSSRDEAEDIEKQARMGSVRHGNSLGTVSDASRSM
ncbi:hypothetical protein BDZ97DRAFT_1921587 [Flammula alnicola]|nr:hypothetical protein BDZ97DRAFT_1921587 [Flammula alnicola]